MDERRLSVLSPESSVSRDAVVLVEQKVDGVTLDGYWARDSVILAPYIRRAGRIELFLSPFKVIATTLIRMVDAVHRSGIILGDLSSRNILVEPDTLQVWLIDFESAVMENEDSKFSRYAVQWGTPGFVHPERGRRDKLTPQDDWYSLGITLYNAVVPVSTLFSLHPGAKDTFIDKFIDLGLPAEVKEIIFCLLNGDVDGAAKATDNL